MDISLSTYRVHESRQVCVWYVPNYQLARARCTKSQPTSRPRLVPLSLPDGPPTHRNETIVLFCMPGRPRRDGSPSPLFFYRNRRFRRPRAARLRWPSFPGVLLLSHRPPLQPRRRMRRRRRRPQWRPPPPPSPAPASRIEVRCLFSSVDNSAIIWLDLVRRCAYWGWVFDLAVRWRPVASCVQWGGRRWGSDSWCSSCTCFSSAPSSSSIRLWTGESRRSPGDLRFTSLKILPKSGYHVVFFLRCF